MPQKYIDTRTNEVVTSIPISQIPYFDEYNGPRDVGRETVHEAVQRLGLVSYDTALPQDWVNDCLSVGFDPRGRFVICYDDGSITGHVRPLNDQAARDIPARMIW